MMRHETNSECQGLAFRKGNLLASVITDGTRVAVYKPAGRSVFPTLGRAIASLEASGWRIEMDAWY